ncbi:MAG TPA: ferritin-like domain-containing protein [Nitrososphaerales archaeon]|nr:ferritin-like domain-containing protein [Nitrososphaerales archaeon]
MTQTLPDEPSSSGSAPPSHLIEIGSREDLVSVLADASTLEHMIMCEYLFAAFSLKKEESEGVSPQDLEAIRSWEGVITTVAIQEMTHLALVNNMLTSVGSGPHFGHPNFPQPSRYFAPNVKLALMPFGDQALRHFLYLERPEGMSIEGVPGFDVLGDLNPPELKGGVTPQQQYFSTVGNLYRGIEKGFRALAEKYGEDGLFIGGRESQATEEVFGLPGLIRVDGLGAASAAVEGIVEMGEGARGDWEHAHFGMFLGVFKSFVTRRSEDPKFRPTKPVVAAYVRPPVGADNVPLITDQVTGKVSDLFNASYSLAIGALSRFYIHEADRQKEVRAIADTAVGTMATVIKPIGNALTRLPVGGRLPGVNAGPTFELQHRDYSLPHREEAMMILQERLGELSGHASAVSDEVQDEAAARDLRSASRALSDLSKGMVLD